MDILRNLFGNLTSGIIRLLVTVGILAAVYFFILRPVLDTTSEAIKEVNQGVQTTFGPTRIDAPPGFSVTVDAKAGQKLAKELRRAFTKAQRRGELPKLTTCIQRANGDIERIRRCARKV